MTVLLPPSAGGLEAGMLNGAAETATDVADDWFLKDRDGKLVRQRKRVWNADPDEDPELEGMHPLDPITLPTVDEDAEEKTWDWFVVANEGDKSAKKPVLWEIHVKDVVTKATEIVGNLPLDQMLKKAIITAAEFHDHGKRRKLFQTVLGNTDPSRWLAKSGKKSGRVKERYRHEFGSLLDVEKELTGEHRDLILHLIAAHHGRARPHFPADEAFDPERPQQQADDMAVSVPQRFARLQRRYGRWGLAYLESLFRAADWAASGNPSAFVEDTK
jgi:CRISPR-associated endonuclease/helicase Cas3